MDTVSQVKSSGRTGWTCLAIASSLALACVWFLGSPRVTNVVMELMADPGAPPAAISLPFSGPSEPASASFRVRADIAAPVFSSKVFRIAPDDCLNAIAINGSDVPEVKNTARHWRCWPKSYTIDLAPYLHAGVNQVILKLSDTGGVYGFDMVGVYDPAAVLAMMACLGLTLYSATTALLGALPEWPGVLRRRWGRLAYLCFLPSLELLTIWAMLVNQGGHAWLQAQKLWTLVAVALPLALLLRLLEDSPPRRVRPSWSYPVALVSIAAATYASLSLKQNAWDSLQLQAIALAGIVAGLFVTVSPRSFLQGVRLHPRALVIAAIAALSPFAGISPFAYTSLKLSIWVNLAGVTGTLVRALLWLCGISAKTFTQAKHGPNGELQDYFAYVTSPDYAVNIVLACSGLEGVFLFLFLLSIFVLYDWHIFSNRKQIWTLYVLTVPVVLLLNVLRITGLFLYAEWTVHHHGNWSNFDMIHRNSGWFVYTVGWAILMPLLYRWRRGAATVQ